MGNGVSSDQGNLPTHGKRDVRRPADRKQHDWSELAVVPETNTLLAVANSYTRLLMRTNAADDGDADDAAANNDDDDADDDDADAEFS